MSQPKRARPEPRRYVEIILLERAILDLEWQADPARSNWTTEHIHGNGQPDASDPTTSWARNALTDALDRVTRLTRDIRAAIRSGPQPDELDQADRRHNRRRGFCSACGKGNRRGAIHCDRCGERL